MEGDPSGPWGHWEEEVPGGAGHLAGGEYAHPQGGQRHPQQQAMPIMAHTTVPSTTEAIQGAMRPRSAWGLTQSASAAMLPA